MPAKTTLSMKSKNDNFFCLNWRILILIPMKNVARQHDEKIKMR